ncbi:MAG: hypothetical protein HKO65_16185 [Gemmatimonadetes bacterium]|nr:hypothetical protein [Gemmatimonadota bacterium]NNM06634.1 hypothetical protein [Gemmatimonadota bacterium]
MLKGLLAAGVTLGIAAVFPEPLAFPFFAAVLGLVVGVYPGIAMALGEAGNPVSQWVVAVAILALGLLGLWQAPILLAGAFLFHAVWSVMHRITGLADGVTEGYPSFCVSFDLVMAAFVAYMAVATGQA